MAPKRRFYNLGSLTRVNVLLPCESDWSIMPREGRLPPSVGFRLTNTDLANAAWFAFGLYLFACETA